MFNSVSKILVTGSTGLVGSRFITLTKNEFDIQTIGRENVDTKIDLTSQREVENSIKNSDVKTVVNFAGFTNVDKAEEEKDDVTGEVYTINTLLPLWLAAACKDSGKSLIHISTDFVFDGLKEDAPYTEEDVPEPVDSWYAKTKYLGEQNVKQGFGDKKNFVIARIAYPYSANYEKKLDFARIIIEKLAAGDEYFGITDQKITPIMVDEIARALSLLINTSASGIYHVAGKFTKGYISPFDFAKHLAKVMELDLTLIKPITFEEFSKKRTTLRPQHTWLNSNKIRQLGMNFSDLENALDAFKKQRNT